jgi:hypothetical protein
VAVTHIEKGAGDAYRQVDGASPQPH